MMVPEKKAELFARGWEYGKQPIASGVVYPSDWEGGQIGATVMVKLMMQKPEFHCASRSLMDGAVTYGPNANAPVRSPAFSRTPGSGSSSKRLVMSFRIDVVSYDVLST